MPVDSNSVDAFHGELADGAVDGRRIRVARILEAQGPKTARELHEITGIDMTAQSPALTALKQAGLVTPVRRVLNESTGRPADLMRLTSDGLAWLAGDLEVDFNVKRRKDYIAEIARVGRLIAVASAATDPRGWVKLHDELKQAHRALEEYEGRGAGAS